MVVISAYFSGSETGMMTLNRKRLRHMAKLGKRSAQRLKNLMRKPDRRQRMVLNGTTTFNILSSRAGTPIVIRCCVKHGMALLVCWVVWFVLGGGGGGGG
ncbi:CNNM domain-containing protein, partial [Escherichia coli]|uniref:CNNM domain-containing protein n=1 Tax=Escherichia coli TaxID=562 RepID=UPI0010CAD9BB